MMQKLTFLVPALVVAAMSSSHAAAKRIAASRDRTEPVTTTLRQNGKLATHQVPHEGVMLDIIVDGRDFYASLIQTDEDAKPVIEVARNFLTYLAQTEQSLFRLFNEYRTGQKTSGSEKEKLERAVKSATSFIALLFMEKLTADMLLRLDKIKDIQVPPSERSAVRQQIQEITAFHTRLRDVIIPQWRHMLDLQQERSASKVPGVEWTVKLTN
jgi:hypothetical protein